MWQEKIRSVVATILFFYLVLLGLASLSPELQTGYLGQISRSIEDGLFLIHLTPGFAVFSDNIPEEPIVRGVCHKFYQQTPDQKIEQVYASSSCEKRIIRFFNSPIDFILARIDILSLQKQDTFRHRQAIVNFFCTRENKKINRLILRSHYVLWSEKEQSDVVSAIKPIYWNCKSGD